ncbi:hypothetical protein NKG94_14385 [Micromonospora sp. M12]
MPPHPTWPIAPAAFADAPTLTPRALLRRVDRHVAWCRDRDAVVELDRLIDGADSTPTAERPAAGPATRRRTNAACASWTYGSPNSSRPWTCRQLSTRSARTSTCRRYSPPAWPPGSPSRRRPEPPTSTIRRPGASPHCTDGSSRCSTRPPRTRRTGASGPSRTPTRSPSPPGSRPRAHWPDWTGTCPNDG